MSINKHAFQIKGIVESLAFIVDIVALFSLSDCLLFCDLCEPEREFQESLPKGERGDSGVGDCCWVASPLWASTSPSIVGLIFVDEWVNV